MLFSWFSSLYADLAEISCPNVLIANDWHSGAIAGLTKYMTVMLQKQGRLEAQTAERIRNIPVIHLAHHLGYQGWGKCHQTGTQKC